MSEKQYKIKTVAFEGPKEPDRGYTIRASYLEEPNHLDALIEVFNQGELVRTFFFPAYKIWNLAAHFKDIVDGEIQNSDSGYREAAWTAPGIAFAGTRQQGEEKGQG